MGKRKKLAKVNKEASGKILEVKAILDALSYMEDTCYPAGVMIEIASEKVIKVFKNIETTRKILKIID